LRVGSVNGPSFTVRAGVFRTAFAISRMAAVALGLVAGATAAAPVAPECAAPLARAAELSVAPAGAALADDLSIAAAADDGDRLSIAGVSWLRGRCADGAHAVRMGLVFFTDGMVFAAGADGRFARVPGLSGLANFGGAPLSADHPPMEGARFIMASNVAVAMVGNDRRSLDVGLWQRGDAYVVAAFARQAGGFGAPIELLRSARPIRSVTFFPSPDAPSGRLGLVVDAGQGIALVDVDWHHRNLSRKLVSGGRSD
jgi:hypothetical protein